MAIAHRISPCLWFDSEGEDAAKFYVGIFPNSKIRSTSRYGEAGKEIHGRPSGSVMTVEFELDGQHFTALNGGPVFKFNEAVSFQIGCADQKEVDYYWDKLTADGGSPIQCRRRRPQVAAVRLAQGQVRGELAGGADGLGAHVRRPQESGIVAGDAGAPADEEDRRGGAGAGLRRELTRSVRLRPVILLVALALALPAHAWAQDEDSIPDPGVPEVESIPDPVRAFIEGFNPEDEDFFAHPPDRTDLLRMQLDVDGDGRPDLAVSESSMFGIGAGPWLLFRQLSTGSYRYLGEIFAGPVARVAMMGMRIRLLRSGASCSNCAPSMIVHSRPRSWTACGPSFSIRT